ncbi:MAG: 5-(carboxyamino)imidazole ribonucleotide synthase [Ilumatobacteraceae bacterium]|nr:5-(carboxyamino)imidazole ribonucleotide synthase [Actinomycetota bacterium]
MSAQRPDQSPITPPATIGMLGGGQLGRYALMAARTMGFRTMVLEPDPEAPAGVVADEHLVADYDDPEALARLAATCSVVTTEFENPSAEAMATLARSVRVAPSSTTVGIAQDRGLEKEFLSSVGVPVGPFARVDAEVFGVGVDDPVPFDRDDCLPGILKTTRGGYDGKGQRSVDDVDGLWHAWRALNGAPCVLERRLSLVTEVSVIVARTAEGSVVTYPVAENRHVDGILDVSVVPARVDEVLADRAVGLAMTVADALGYVGVLAVEMFIVDGDDGPELLVNEIAPRPHNSGHWTLDGSRTDQFTQQVRAICGLALGDTAMTAGGVAMVNLLGDLWDGGEPDWSAVLAEPRAHLHLYGKRTARPGRKMGHLTVVDDDSGAAEVIARRLRETVSRG